jgi:hypothetical protein
MRSGGTFYYLDRDNCEILRDPGRAGAENRILENLDFRFLARRSVRRCEGGILGLRHDKRALIRGRRRSVAARAQVFLIALTAAFASSAPAQAGCSASDLSNAVGQLISKFPLACLDDPEFVLALPYVIGILQAPQGATICNDIEAASGDLGKAKTLLNKSGIADSGLLADVSGLLSDAADAANLASCACQTAQDPGWQPFLSQVSACLQDFFCTVDRDCSGSSIIIQQIDCAISPCPPGSFNLIENCTGPGIFGPDNSGNSPNGVSYQSSAGGVVVTQSDGFGPSGGQTVYECFCPYPMQIGWANATQNTGTQIIDLPFLTCKCPTGTSPPANKTGPVTSACVCDSGPLAGQPAPLDGNCTPPTGNNNTGCPAGEKAVGGTCVSANGCSDPTKVMLANGSCCDPAKAAACGECCTDGQVADTVSGRCMPASSTPMPRHPAKP